MLAADCRQAGRRVSRPTKLTKVVRESVCQAIRAGLPLREAALVAGISERTLHAWRERGAREESGPYLQFVQQTREAEAQAQFDLAVIVKSAAIAGDWRAALALLGRRWPGTWSEHSRHEVSGPEGGPVDVAGVVDLALDRAQASIERAGRG